MYIVSILIFIVISGIHLYASYKKNRLIRNLSKIFIIPSLAVIYCLNAPKVEISFLLALLFSWIGDLVLIPHGKAFFTAGGVSFIISHIFFIITYSKHIHSIKTFILLIIVAALIYLIITTIVFKHLVKYLPKFLIIPMYIYLLVNASMNCAAFTLLLSNMTLASMIVFIGALSFFISDTNLFFVRFKKELAEQNHFVVMFTYILAELLIIVGIINI